ncbi:hypothetical protein Hanom_Chr10g00906221 [Helianthus anomalus]
MRVSSSMVAIVDASHFRVYGLIFSCWSCSSLAPEFLELYRNTENDDECVRISPFITHTSDRMLLLSQQIVPVNQTKKDHYNQFFFPISWPYTPDPTYTGAPPGLPPKNHYHPNFLISWPDTDPAYMGVLCIRSGGPSFFFFSMGFIFSVYKS